MFSTTVALTANLIMNSEIIVNMDQIYLLTLFNNIKRHSIIKMSSVLRTPIVKPMVCLPVSTGESLRAEGGCPFFMEICSVFERNLMHCVDVAATDQTPPSSCSHLPQTMNAFHTHSLLHCACVHANLFALPLH